MLTGYIYKSIVCLALDWQKSITEWFLPIRIKSMICIDDRRNPATPLTVAGAQE